MAGALRLPAHRRSERVTGAHGEGTFLAVVVGHVAPVDVLCVIQGRYVVEEFGLAGFQDDRILVRLSVDNEGRLAGA